MKLNCDLGESFGSWTMGLDAEVMPHIDQANIATGFHAGDPVVIRRTLRLAKENRVTVGAHPAYPDLVGFGRRSMNCSRDEIIAKIHYQVAALDEIAAQVSDCVAQQADAAWIRGGQWGSDFFVENQLESPRAFLDAVSGDKAVALSATCENSMNSGECRLETKIWTIFKSRLKRPILRS